MKLSVVIPCYNAERTLSVQLEALGTQRWQHPWEIVLADNRSTDGSRAIAERYREKLPNLRVVDASERQGQPFALNTGAAAARGESLAFCDADDEVGSNWVAAVGDALSDRHEFVACRIDTTKLNPHWISDGIGKVTQRNAVPRIWYPPYLPHAGGGTLGVKRYLHERVGGFDEALPYLHDTDYCFKVQQSGVALQFVPEAVIHVRYRQGLLGLFHQGRHWAQYNVKVYKRYRFSGAPDLKKPWVRYGYGWVSTVRDLPGARDKKGAAQLMWKLGWQIGLLQGSLESGVPPVAR